MTTAEYTQNGVVWQCEEVFKDGKWERYFGFVGPHGVTKVPAAEIELPGDSYNWQPLSGGVDCFLTTLAVTVLSNDDMVKPAKRPPFLGETISIAVKLRNRSGADQSVPSEFFKSDAKQGSTLLTGITPRLRYVPASSEDLAELTTKRDPPESQWKVIASKEIKHFPRGDTVKAAGPAAEFAEFILNLNDWFDLPGPGYYRLQLTFASANGGLADGVSREIQFTMKEPPRGQ